MMKEEAWQRFHEFEIKNNLFDLVDKNGIYIWDIFRYYIFSIILDNTHKPRVKIGLKEKIKTYIRPIYYLPLIVFSFIRIRNKQIKNLFLICSRNIEKKKGIDRNVNSILDLISQNEKIVIDSGLYRNIEALPIGLLYCFEGFYKKKLDSIINVIIELVYTEYGIKLSNSYLIKLYTRFYYDKMVYNFILKKSGIQRVFMTQNGIQKGLFYESRKCNVDVYEIQHGAIECGHMAYHYPVGLNPTHVYLPKFFLTYSKHWEQNIFMPGTTVISVGNDYVHKKFDIPKSENILVVSANIYGAALSSFLKKALDEGIINENLIYYKLHPNEFNNIGHYQTYFKGYDNVRIIKDEYSAEDLVNECKFIFCVQSTVMYQALQNNRIVFIYNPIFKERFSYIADKNILYVDKVDDIKNVLNSQTIPNECINYFCPLDIEMLKNIILR